MDISLMPFATSGEVRAVESKSDAHRALICASLCDGETKIKIRTLNDDIKATAGALNSLGARVEKTESGFTVSRKASGGGTLDCRESGSTLRFLMPVAAALGKATTFIGGGRLPKRPMLALTSQMRSNGCSVSADFLPITVTGKLKAGRYTIAGNVSSQFISGLLMALPLTGGRCEIMLTSPLESSLYADMTLCTLRRFGVKWQKLTAEQSGGFFGGYLYEGRANQSFCTACTERDYQKPFLSAGEYKVEGDWSGAAFFAVAAALSGELKLTGLDTDSLQPDKAIIDVCALAGATVTKENGEITVKKCEIKPIKVDVSQFPDIFPILAVLACGAKGESLLYNAGRLRIKESDRIETTAAMIRALGGNVEVGADSLKILGTGELKGGTVDGANDHRIVMSAAVAASLCRDEVKITGYEAVGKSFPDFFDVLASVKCEKA